MDEAFADRLGSLRQQLAAMRASRTSTGVDSATADGALPIPPAGSASCASTGTSSAGAVRAVAEGGKLCSVEFEPRLMRLPAETLGELLTEAVCAALRDAAPQRAPDAVADASTADVPADLGTLGRQLAEVQVQAARSMQMITDGLTSAMAKVGERTGMRGDPSLFGLQMLLDDTGSMLDLAAAGCAAAAEAPQPSAGGRGADDAGLIAAEVDESGVEVGLTLHPAVMRQASQDIGEGVVVAVNRALATRRQALAEQAKAPLADLAGLPDRVCSVQDQGLARMRAQTQGLTAIMASIREP